MFQLARGYASLVAFGKIAGPTSLGAMSCSRPPYFGCGYAGVVKWPASEG